MKETISKELKEIEREYKFKIVLAVDGGSRSWNLHSPTSDYDVRFIWVRDKWNYLSLDRKEETLTIKKGDTEYEGKDIFKFLNLLRNSNPTVIEWINSPIVFLNKMVMFEELKEEVNNNFNPLALFYHYKSLCKENYLKYLKSHSQVTYKRYLYAMRGLINSKWVLTKGTLPDMDFELLLSDIRKFLPESIVENLIELIRLKKGGHGKESVQNISNIDNFIETFLKKKEEPLPKKKFNTKIFNEILKAEIVCSGS